MFDRVKRWLFNQFRDNFIVYFIITVIFIIGIAMGAVTIKILNIEQKNEIILFINSFFKIIEGNTFDSISIFKQGAIDNFKTIILIWITGIVIIGFIVIPMVILFRGFAMGFTVGFLINEYGFKGFLFSILGILPHNLLIIPSIISIASIGMAMSISNFKKKGLNIRGKSLYFNIIDYSVLILFFSIFILTGCLIEAYISPIFLRLLSNYLK